jgi:hypothetical protein
VAGTECSCDAVEERLQAFVLRLRDDGRTPEQVLVALKREITERGALHLRPSLCVPMPAKRDQERAVAYERLFHWFLEAYFDEPDSQRGSAS